MPIIFPNGVSGCVEYPEHTGKFGVEDMAGFRGKTRAEAKPSTERTPHLWFNTL